LDYICILYVNVNDVDIGLAETSINNEEKLQHNDFFTENNKFEVLYSNVGDTRSRNLYQKLVRVSK